MNFAKWKHYLRARLFQVFRNDDAALAEYQLTLQAAPDSARAAACIGFIHAKRGNFAATATHFHNATQIDPSDAEMQFNLGFVLDKLNRREEAIVSFRDAIRLKPALDRAWYGLGMAHAALGQHEEAAKDFAEAALLQPMNPHAWYALGMAYHHAHNPDKVKDVVEHMLRFDPVMTRQLIRDAERADLAHLVKDLLI